MKLDFLVLGGLAFCLGCFHPSTAKLCRSLLISAFIWFIKVNTGRLVDVWYRLLLWRLDRLSFCSASLLDLLDSELIFLLWLRVCITSSLELLLLGATWVTWAFLFFFQFSLKTSKLNWPHSAGCKPWLLSLSWLFDSLLSTFSWRLLLNSRFLLVILLL